MRELVGVGVLAGLVSVLFCAGCAGKEVSLGGRELGGNGGAGGVGGGADGTGADAGMVELPDGGQVHADVVPNKTGGVKHSSKLDLLLVIDNSISMADKQRILGDTIPDLVNRVTAVGSGVDDLHLGVITTSLGDHGDGNTCLGVDNDPTDPTLEQQDDHAHLITTRPRAASLGLPPVLTWTRGGADVTTLTNQVQSAVSAVDEFGCGLEAQLEAVYRFLADPEPPASIQKQPCPGTTAEQKQPCAVPTGRDDVLLQQRAQFLRPDSAVGIVLLTDENDCSIQDRQQLFYAARQDIVLPHGTSVCDTNPNDRCCYSCAGAVPSGCSPDPTCAVKPDATLDTINLRCFNEKQRFGLDFLYPVARYVNALSKTSLCKSRVDLQATTACPASDIVDNPLFVQNGTVRDPSMVYFLGIIGVPWQDITGAGTDATHVALKTPADFLQDGTWDQVLGKPLASPPVLPTDGLMVESRSPRSGADIDGKPIPGPAATRADDNAINGHDWANGYNDDLMYACTFPLTATRDCTVVEQQHPSPGCDCGSSSSPGDNNPLCEVPATNTYGAVQYRAKAYPGLRELSVLKGLGGQGLVASVCARNLADDSRQDYGYRPAIELLLHSVGPSLQ